MNISITIIRTKVLSARAIHLGMFLFALLRGKKITKSYNHCEVRYGDLTSGAIAEGVKTRNWEEYKASRKYFKHIDYWIDITDEQWLKVKAHLDETEGIPYEFENFWFHTVKIFTGKWKGSTKSKELYCYEHGIRVLNLLGYDLDTNTNPYQFKVWADKNLR